eukprot:10424997-Alexandrium_andersonii.AAC.1
MPRNVNPKKHRSSSSKLLHRSKLAKPTTERRGQSRSTSIQLRAARPRHQRLSGPARAMAPRAPAPQRHVPEQSSGV